MNREMKPFVYIGIVFAALLFIFLFIPVPTEDRTEYLELDLKYQQTRLKCIKLYTMQLDTIELGARWLGENKITAQDFHELLSTMPNEEGPDK
jgi:hypothetical protein